MAPPIPYRGPLRVPGVRTCPLGRACGSAATVPLLPTRQVQGLVRRAQLNLPNHPNLFCEGLLRAEKIWGTLLFFGSDRSVFSELPAKRTFEWFSEIPARASQFERRDSPDHILRPVLLSRWFRNPRSASCPPNRFCEPACSPVSSHQRFHAPHNSPAKASSS